MKTYKTWEVIKMITENKKLKFKNYLGEEMGYYNNLIRFFRNGENVSLYGIAEDEEWTLIQEPVNFMTAVQSGKRMKVEHERMDTFSCLDEYESLATILGVLTDNYCGKTIRLILTEGKFYIEE